MKRLTVVGLDLGTSAVKAVLLDESGRLMAEATAEYPLSTPRPGWSEQDPADWWTGVGQAIRTLLQNADENFISIEAVALSGQMHGATVLDAVGNILRPCILWNDQRSSTQCDAITQQFGLSSLLEWVSNPALAGFTAPKLVWMREHEPDLYSRIATVLLPKDYVNFRLTGERATEVSDASGTLLFDIGRRRWSDEMIHALQLPRSWMPEVHESIGIVGRTTREAALHTGLPQGIPVVAGGADNACAAIGVGVIDPRRVLISIGTSGTVVAPSASHRVDPQGRLHSFCHAVPGTWYQMGVVLSAGGSLRWYRDVLAGIEEARAATEGRDVYEILIEEAAEAPRGAEGLIFLPYLTGERTPHGDPNARGAFVGLTVRHQRSHLVRSVIEGVSFALADSVVLMRQAGVDINAARVTGGGARSHVWRHILADVMDVHVSTVSPEVGPAMGAAILAGVGCGLFPSIEDAVERCLLIGEAIKPDGQAHREYQVYGDVYDALYTALKPHFDRLTRLASESESTGTR